jgi:flagellar hook-length control protein FliK
LPLAAIGKASLEQTAQFASAIGPASDKTLVTGPASNGAAGLLTGAIAPPAASTSSATPTAPVPGLADASASVAATPAALAASITAMARDGHASAILRLDPPGLGQLAIHIALGAGSQINVQFVPAVAHTGHLLANGMDELRQNLATAGLTLGQTQIGGGQAGNQGGYSGSDGGASPRQQSAADTNKQTYTNAAGAATPGNGPNGVRAYA